MRRLALVLEAALWAAVGIVLNMQGALGAVRLYLPGTVLSLAGLAMMTLALSAKARNVEGLLGTSRDAATRWALRGAALFSLVMAAASFGRLWGVSLAPALDMVLLGTGCLGLLICLIALGRQFRA